MNDPVPSDELNARMARFRAVMDVEEPDWELAIFLGRVNHFYFTGTMQDGLLVVPRDGEAVYFVRRSFERACDESAFHNIRPIKSLRDAAQALGASTRKSIHFETGLVPFGLIERVRCYFPCERIASLDRQIARIRSVKSPYELTRLELAGEIHRRVLEEKTAQLLHEGISEAAFACALFSLLVAEGHQGTARFNKFNTEIVLGQLGFGENSLYPTNFDGPGGCRGMGPWAPVLGSRDRKLKKGDLVFVDVGCGIEGYVTDKTMVFAYGAPLPDEALAAHERCVQVMNQVASLLKPGAIPSQIYTTVLENLDPDFLVHFMGFGNKRARFLGHGVGLEVDEPPVIAEGFDEPLAEGMVLAIEPKRGVPNVGMVGLENTFVVTSNGGRSITGSCPGPIFVAA